jgi:hypothetical protein
VGNKWRIGTSGNVKIVVPKLYSDATKIGKFCGIVAMHQWLKKTHFQASAGKPNEKIFPKFQIVGTNGDYALPEM